MSRDHAAGRLTALIERQCEQLMQQIAALETLAKAVENESAFNRMRNAIRCLNDAEMQLAPIPSMEYPIETMQESIRLVQSAKVQR